MFEGWLDEDSPIRQVLLYGFVVLVVAVGAYAVYAYWNAGEIESEVAMMCANEDCLYITDRQLQIGETYPMECPECGQKTLYPAFRCPDCGTANIWNETLGKEPPTICRECGRRCYHD